MNSMSSKRVRDASGSLIERAAEAYGFGAVAVSPFKPTAQSFASSVEEVRPLNTYTGPVAVVDRDALRASGFIVPGAAPTGLSEEFRLVKRQLLLSALVLSLTNSPWVEATSAF